MRTLIASLFLIAACGGGSSGGGDDTPTPDAPAATDGPSGNACTKATFDPCTTGGDCTSGNCHFFMQSNFSVCTQACTPGDNSTCPVDSTGVNGTCNNMGICKPAAANNCTP